MTKRPRAQGVGYTESPGWRPERIMLDGREARPSTLCSLRELMMEKRASSVRTSAPDKTTHRRRTPAHGRWFASRLSGEVTR